MDPKSHEQRSGERHHRKQQHAQESIDVELQGRALISRLLRSVRQTACIRGRANGGDTVDTRACGGIGARVDRVAHTARHTIGLSRQDRLVDREAASLDEFAVRDDLVARLQLDDVIGHQLFGQHRAGRAVASNGCVGGNQQRQTVERVFGAQLLGDANQRIDHDHRRKQRILPRPRSDDQDHEAERDQIDQRKDVATQDRPQRNAGGVLALLAKGAALLLGLRRGETRVCSCAHV